MVAISTLDCKLSRIIIDSNLRRSIVMMNRQITELLWNVSMASNFVVLYLLHCRKKIPSIDRTFFFAIIYHITKEPYNGSDDKTKSVMDSIKSAIDMYKSTGAPMLSRKYCSDVLEVIVKDNLVETAKLNVSTNFFNIQKALIYVLLKNKYKFSAKILSILSINLCSFINDKKKKSFDFEKIGLFESKKKYNMEKWSNLKKYLFGLCSDDKTKLIKSIRRIIYNNNKYVNRILDKINEHEKTKKYKITTSLLKKYPHLFLRYMNKINKYFTTLRQQNNSFDFTAPKKYRYTADKRDYTEHKYRTKRKKVMTVNICDEMDDDNNTFDFSLRKYIRAHNLLPLRTGKPCFITFSSGSRFMNLINYHFMNYKSLLVRAPIIPKNKDEKDIYLDIQDIYLSVIELLRTENNYDGLLKSVHKKINNLYMKLKNKISPKIHELHNYLMIHIDSINRPDVLANLIDFLQNNWLFKIKKINNKRELIRNDCWWKCIFNLDARFKQLKFKYMLTKKSHHHSENVFDVLQKYISTDGYQIKVQFGKKKLAHNVQNLYHRNYDSIKCNEDELKNIKGIRGIYDINDVSIKTEELNGKVLRGVDPGIANVLSWTEVKLDINCNINKEELKNTDKTVTNGDYQNSWYKGPYRVIEKKLREKYKVEEIFCHLQKYSLRDSNLKNMINYLTILYLDDNYRRILKYKFNHSRKKWKYKRLLGKRSYIGKITNSLVYGADIKKCGRKRKTFKTNRGNEAIIIFGAGCYKTSMRNYSAVPRKAILRVLCQKTLVLLQNEFNTTKLCFKCGNKLEEIKEISKKRIGRRQFDGWSKSNLRNVRCCKNMRCRGDIFDKFIIGRDVNASNNILINGLNNLKINKCDKLKLLGGKQPKT